MNKDERDHYVSEAIGTALASPDLPPDEIAAGLIAMAAIVRADSLSEMAEQFRRITDLVERTEAAVGPLLLLIPELAALVQQELDDDHAARTDGA